MGRFWKFDTEHILAALILYGLLMASVFFGIGVYEHNMDLIWATILTSIPLAGILLVLIKQIWEEL